MINLYIDTRNNAKVSARLDVDNAIFEAFSDSPTKRPESILTLVDSVCNKAQIKPSDIDEIYVEEGPGSYTGLKVGVSVANALSFSLNKKINGKPLGEIVEPTYQ